MATTFHAVEEYVNTNEETLKKHTESLDRMKEDTANRENEGRKLLDSLPELLQMDISLETQSLRKKVEENAKNNARLQEQIGEKDKQIKNLEKRIKDL